MAVSAQERALKNYRKRLAERGVARFEVLGLEADRDLIRAVARRLAENDPGSGQIRATLRSAISPERKKGDILAALRRSPMVGAELDLRRPRVASRPLDL